MHIRAQLPAVFTTWANSIMNRDTMRSGPNPSPFPSPVLLVQVSLFSTLRSHWRDTTITSEVSTSFYSDSFMEKFIWRTSSKQNLRFLCCEFHRALATLLEREITCIVSQAYLLVSLFDFMIQDTLLFLYPVFDVKKKCIVCTLGIKEVIFGTNPTHLF